MTSMRERMARAMLERAKGNDLYFDGLLVREAALDNLLVSFGALADAALDALMEQPQCVTQVLWDACLDHSGYDLTLWPDMIQAIKEGK